MYANASKIRTKQSVRDMKATITFLRQQQTSKLYTFLERSLFAG